MITLDDGVRLHCQQLGSGYRIVLIPNGFHLLQELKFLAASATLVFYDVRNRGRSDAVTEPAKLAGGILQDVQDLDAVRRHFGRDRVDLIGHSYIGRLAALYAMEYPERAGRAVLLSPIQPDPAKQYPPHLMYADATMTEVTSRIAVMRKEPPAGNPEEICRNFWRVLRLIYVTNPEDAERIDWGRCDLENERRFGTYWMGHLWPSIQKLRLGDENFAKAMNPVLVVHGTKDRSAPYGGARDWALRLPNARLVTVPGAGHALWIESPEIVFNSIAMFLEGAWPQAAKEVQVVD